MKLCSYCGVALERDDARFCQKCGKPTSSHSPSPTASSAASPAEEQFEDTLRMPVVKKPRKNQPSLPEQIAQQPWSHRPAMQARTATQQEQERPVLRDQVAIQPPDLEEEASQPAQSVETFSEPPPRAEPPAQELHAEIADQHATGASAPADIVQNTPVPATPSSLDELSSTPPPLVFEETEVSEQEPEIHNQEEANDQGLEASEQEPEIHNQEPEANDLEEDAIEDRPTFLMESASVETLASDPTDAADSDSGNKPSTRPAIVQPIPAKFSAFPDAASRFTSPLPAVVQSSPTRPRTFSDIAHKLTSPLPAIVQSIPAKLSELPATMRELTSPLPSVAQSIPAKLSALPAAMRELTPSAPALPRTHQRLPIPVVSAVLAAIVLIGVGSWLVFAQPFSVPSVTQPLLDFSDAHLGLSLLYPNGWTSKKDASDSTVQFYDSSHTAQVIIASSNTNNSTITAALQKQSAQLGMSGAKSVAPLTFAGASWQAMQGTVQQNSASYTCTIFVTTHANRLVIWTQLAPQGVYNQEESVIFSAMRQSLRFL